MVQELAPVWTVPGPCMRSPSAQWRDAVRVRTRQKHVCDAHLGTIRYINFCVHHSQRLTSHHRIFHTIWQKASSTTTSGAASCCRRRTRKRYWGSARRAASPSECLLLILWASGAALQCIVYTQAVNHDK